MIQQNLSFSFNFGSFLLGLLFSLLLALLLLFLIFFDSFFLLQMLLKIIKSSKKINKNIRKIAYFMQLRFGLLLLLHNIFSIRIFKQVASLGFAIALILIDEMAANREKKVKGQQ